MVFFLRPNYDFENRLWLTHGRTRVSLLAEVDLDLHPWVALGDHVDPIVARSCQYPIEDRLWRVEVADKPVGRGVDLLDSVQPAIGLAGGQVG